MRTRQLRRYTLTFSEAEFRDLLEAQEYFGFPLTRQALIGTTKTAVKLTAQMIRDKKKKDATQQVEAIPDTEGAADPTPAPEVVTQDAGSNQ